MTKKILFVGGWLIIIATLLFFIALFAGVLPPDKDGYHYEYLNGQIIKSKTFAPPAGTTLMTEMVDGKVVNYYGTTTEQQQ
ncbi:MAG: hypothetical protein AAB555_01590 [Patescibacteria group bacterium]